MASKSKRRGRVFRASCILAALIIAGSSFAWFTSKDEVTNRLSASGDYDVSIVESFAPPANWVPGQAVNKDVYAVNTGDVDAYVKESVSSVMTIVTEKATEGITEPDADCIELSPAERYVVEAGAYLAYAPLASEYTYDTGADAGIVKEGRKVIAMSPEPRATEDDYTSTAVTDFTPDAAGLYVFRRTIGVDDDTQLENYTYDGYYYVPGTDAIVDKTDPANPVVTQPAVPAKFYKISNLAVTPVKATFAGDRDDTDGTLKTATAGFYKDVTETVVPTLTYDADNNRLVAIYDTGTGVDQAKLLQLAGDYEDKAIAYEDALEEYRAAVGDQQTGRNGNNSTDAELATASNNLQAELANLLAKQRAMNTAKKNYDDGVAEKDRLYAAMQAAQSELTTAAGNYGAAGDGAANRDTVMGRYERAQAALGNPSDNTAGTAYGDEYLAKAARDTALGSATPAPGSGYLGAKALREAAEPESRNAFLDLVVQKCNEDSSDGLPDIDTTQSVADQRAAAEAYINSLTYTQMTGLGIVNTGDPEYDYYTKVVNEKYAKEALDNAQAAYEAAIADRVAAQNAFAIAEAEKNAAEAALGTGADATAVYDPTTGANDTANGRFNYAKQQYDAQMVRLYGTGHETDGDENHYEDDNTCLFDLYQDAIADRDNAQNEVNAKQALYNAALTNSNTAATNVTNAANALAKAKQEMDDAWNAYQNAFNEDSGKLKININLGDVTTTGGVADKWQLLPESLEDLYNNTTTAEYEAGDVKDNIKDTASFYYTSVLGGGETTSKLIDSVELDPSVTKEMFKYFDFDLNIALNSVQVNVDSNGNYTAETAATELGKYAILSEPANADSTITWSDTSTLAPGSTPTTYTNTIGGNEYTITALTTPKFINYVDYNYVIVDGDDKYYGQNTTNGTVFYKYDSANDVLLTGAGNELALNGDATPTT